MPKTGSEKTKRPSEEYDDALYETSTTRKVYSQECLKYLEQTFECEIKLLTRKVKAKKKVVPQLSETENEETNLDFEWNVPDNFTDRIAILNKRLDNLSNILDVVNKSDFSILKERFKHKVSKELEQR